jgi:hypothetical protein
MAQRRPPVTGRRPEGLVRGRIAWGIAALSLAALAIPAVFDPLFDLSAVVVYAIGITSFVGVGAVLSTRVPSNPIGIMLLVAGSLLVTALVIGTYGHVGAAQAPPWPGSMLARLAEPILFLSSVGIALIGVPLVFPDGRLPSRRFRWVVWISVADMVALGLLSVIEPREDGSAAVIPGLVVPDPIIVATVAFALAATATAFGAGVVAVGLRFRRGDQVQRHQVKWLVVVAGLAALVLPGSFVGTMIPGSHSELDAIVSTVSVLILFALPIFVALAILRYRLFEIDRIISRTVSWAIVTGVLVAVFAGGLVAIPAALAGFTHDQTLAVAASTLAAFALFQPLRRRVQSVVDRRFDRARYDGERVVAEFSARLRDQVDLTMLSAEIRQVAVETVRPSATGLWLREASKS